MSVPAYKQLTKIQYFLFILHAIVGISLLTLPHILGKSAGHDGLISLLITTFAVQILILLFTVIIRRYPDLTFFEVMTAVYGKPLGTFINICIILYYTLYNIHIVHQCITVLNAWIYYRTPIWVLSAFFCFACFYIAKGDLLSIARFIGFATVFIVFYTIFILIACKEMNPLYLLPIGEAGILDILSGSKNAFPAFAGFEIFLYLHAFRVMTVKEKKKLAIGAVWTTSALYFLTAIIVFLNFPNSRKILEYAVIYLLVPIQFSFVERMELFFIGGWVVTMATSCIIYLFISSLGISKLTRKKDNHMKFVKYVAAFVYIMAIVASKMTSSIFWDIYHLIQFYLTYVFIAGIPAVTAVVILFRNRAERKGLNEGH